MVWSQVEEEMANPLFIHFERYKPVARSGERHVPLDLREAEHLKTNVPDPMDERLSLPDPANPGLLNPGSLFLRHLLKDLGFDERRLPHLRFEHKLVQAVVLHHYAPTCMPVTFGSSRCFADLTPLEIERKISDLYDNGFFLKAALGENSKRSQSADQLEAFRHTIGSSPVFRSPLSLEEESYIVQQKMAIVREFRVHTLESFVIPSLTFDHTALPIMNPVHKPSLEHFMQQILDSLPDGLKADSLWGWDVGQLADGTFCVIEVNTTGFHEAFKRGFHCSGLFQSRLWSVRNLAHLTRFIESVSGKMVTIREPERPYDNYGRRYHLIAIYRKFLNRLHRLGLSETPLVNVPIEEYGFMDGDIPIELNTLYAMIGELAVLIEEE